MNGTSKARLHWIFVGSRGIRAGWSVLIFFAILTAFALAAHLVRFGFSRGPAHAAKAALPPSGPIAPAFLLVREVLALAATLGATAIMGWIEGRRFWTYGFTGPRPVLNFASGAAGGMFCMSLMVALLVAGGAMIFGGASLHGLDVVRYGLLWGLVFVCVGLSEEWLFRGYLQTTLTRGIGFWPAAAIISLSFGAAHFGNPGETAAGLAGVVVFGLVFSLLLWLSGSLWLGIGFHAAWDWAQSYFYGTPDSGMLMRGHLFATLAAGNPRISGGSAGPEASVLLIPVLAVGLVLLLLVLRRAGLFAHTDAMARDWRWRG